MAPALVPWTRKFPHEFFREVYRLLGWEYKPGQIKHPQYMEKFINKYVYEALPPGVLDELKRRLPKNENGNRRAKLWQLLAVDTGSPHLDKQLTADITLMQASDSKPQFEENFEKVLGKQPRLPFATPIKELKAWAIGGPFLLAATNFHLQMTPLPNASSQGAGAFLAAEDARGGRVAKLFCRNA